MKRDIYTRNLNLMRQCRQKGKWGYWPPLTVKDKSFYCFRLPDLETCPQEVKNDILKIMEGR